MRKLFNYLFIFALIFAGCSNNTPVNYKNKLIGNTFILFQENRTAPISLSFTESEFSGFSGVSSYSGTYSVEGKHLTLDRNFSLLNSGNADLEAIENEYLDNISKVENFDIRNSMLTLYLSSGDIMVFFKN